VLVCGCVVSRPVPLGPGRARPAAPAAQDNSGATAFEVNSGAPQGYNVTEEV